MRRILNYICVIFTGIIISLLVGCGNEVANDRTFNDNIVEVKNAIAPISSNDYIGIDYFEMESLLYNSGFMNIYATPIERPSSDYTYKNGEINFIKIGDKVNFQKNDVFDPYTKVDIKYIVLVDSYGDYVDSSYSNIQSMTDSITTDKNIENSNEYNNSDTINTASSTATNVYSDLPSQEIKHPEVKTQPQDNTDNIGTVTNVGESTTSQQTSIDQQSGNPTNSAENASQTSNTNQNANQTSLAKGDKYDSDGILIYIEPDADGEVWVPVRGGKKYHRKSECSGMIEPVWVNVEHATNLGYTPCKKCTN